MNKPIKIAFSGKMSSGKTEAAKTLAILSYHNQYLKLADPVYECARAYFNMEDKDRILLQELGKFGRTWDPNLWLDKLLKKSKEFEKCSNPPHIIVCDDVRFTNEARALKKDGYYLVRIESMERIRRQRSDKNFVSVYDKSETDLDHYTDWDFIIRNDNISLDEFHSQINKIYLSLVSQRYANERK